jgi:hypothetical protein
MERTKLPKGIAVLAAVFGARITRLGGEFCRVGVIIRARVIVVTEETVLPVVELVNENRKVVHVVLGLAVNQSISTWLYTLKTLHLWVVCAMRMALSISGSAGVSFFASSSSRSPSFVSPEWR